MASLFRALATKNCTLVLRRSFALAARTTTTPGPHATTVGSPDGPDPSTAFETLRGVVDDNTLKAIKHTYMSPVQARIFPLLPDLALPYNPDTPRTKDKPRDLLVKAKTGTGKTMGFLIPAIEARLKAIDAHLQNSLEDSGITVTPQFKAKAINRYATDRVGTLIVSPTRELATQIAVEAANLTAKHVGFQVRILLGGESKYRQIKEWQGRKDIVVCTPGRILDLLESQPQFAEALKYTQVLILDEADTLLQLGFRDDIESIKSYLPNSPERQTFLFSATVSPAIRQVALSTLSMGHKYINCVADDDSPVHDHIPQYHTVVADPSQMFPTLLRLITHDQLTMGDKSKIIVFFSTTKTVQIFSDFLVRAGPKILPSGRKTKVYEMHSKRDMDRRMAISKNFRTDMSGAAILVTSDVSARGVDYPGVSRVIQMGVPPSGDMYIHRVGRTGRGDNKTGRGDLVLCSWEMGFVRRQLRSMPLKPLTTSVLQEQTRELAIVKDTENAAPGKEPIYSHRLAEIEPICRTIATNTDEATAHETFMSQVGFYLGRISELGLNKDEVVSGLQAWTQEVFGLTRPPIIPYGVQTRLGLLGNENRTPSRGSNSYGSSRTAPWMGRGSRSTSSRSPWSSGSRSDSSYGQQRSGGSSYGQQRSGDSSSYGQQRSGDSSYGQQRSGGSSYGQQRSGGSSYGQQRSGGSSYGQQHSGSYGSTSYGSRDKPSYGGGGSIRGSSSSRFSRGRGDREQSSSSYDDSF